jgi:hypothetical protein
MVMTGPEYIKAYFAELYRLLPAPCGRDFSHGLSLGADGEVEDPAKRWRLVQDRHLEIGSRSTQSRTAGRSSQMPLASRPYQAPDRDRVPSAG